MDVFSLSIFDTMIICVVCELHIGRGSRDRKEHRERKHQKETERLRRLGGRERNIISSRRKKAENSRERWEESGKGRGKESTRPRFLLLFGSLYSRMVIVSFKRYLHRTPLKPYRRHRTSLLGPALSSNHSLCVLTLNSHSYVVSATITLTFWLRCIHILWVKTQ